MTDTATVRIVVLFLGLLSLMYGGGLIWLVSVGTPVDHLAIVAGPGGTVIGALATLLVSTRSGPSGQVLTSTLEQTTTTTNPPPAELAVPTPSQPESPYRAVE